MISVLQVFRKKNPAFFSIEKVFALIEPELLLANISLTRIELPYYNAGILSILRNLFYLGKRRFNGLYHVTGDAHYALLALPPARTVLTIHDCVFLHTAAGFKRKVLKWLFLDMPVRRAAVITTISEFTRQEIIRFTDCAADKVLVIPNPINKTIFYKEQAFNNTKPVILFIGVTPNKNLERVAPALEGISCHLRVLGVLNADQEQLLLRHQVEFSVLSNISETALANLYAEADMVLFPSTFEGFGLPILEAQQAGRIVITSNIEPMQTVAGGGACLVNPYDTRSIRMGIQKMIDEDDTRNAFIKRGFINIDNYNTASVAAAYNGVYQMLSKRIAGINKTV